MWPPPMTGLFFFALFCPKIGHETKTYPEGTFERTISLIVDFVFTTLVWVVSLHFLSTRDRNEANFNKNVVVPPFYTKGHHATSNGEYL